MSVSEGSKPTPGPSAAIQLATAAFREVAVACAENRTEPDLILAKALLAKIPRHDLLTAAYDAGWFRELCQDMFDEQGRVGATDEERAAADKLAALTQEMGLYEPLEWCPRCEANVGDIHYTQDSSTQERCGLCHAVLTVTPVPAQYRDSTHYFGDSCVPAHADPEVQETGQ